MGNDSLEKKGTARELSLVKAPLVKAGCPRIRPDTAHSTSLWPEADFRVFPSTSAGMEEGPAGCWLPWFEASYLLQGGWELSWEPCGFTLSGPVAGFPGPLPLISQSPWPRPCRPSCCGHQQRLVKSTRARGGHTAAPQQWQLLNQDGSQESQEGIWRRVCLKISEGHMWPRSCPEVNEMPVSQHLCQQWVFSLRSCNWKMVLYPAFLHFFD